MNNISQEKISACWIRVAFPCNIFTKMCSNVKDVYFTIFIITLKLWLTMVHSEDFLALISLSRTPYIIIKTALIFWDALPSQDLRNVSAKAYLTGCKRKMMVYWHSKNETGKASITCFSKNCTGLEVLFFSNTNTIYLHAAAKTSGSLARNHTWRMQLQIRRHTLKSGNGGVGGACFSLGKKIMSKGQENVWSFASFSILFSPFQNTFPP